MSTIEKDWLSALGNKPKEQSIAEGEMYQGVRKLDRGVARVYAQRAP